MNIIFAVIETLGLILGSMAVGVVLCALLCAIFRRVHHPEWGAIALFVAVAGAFVAALPQGMFLRLTLIFALLAAIPFGLAGLSWRKRWHEEHRAAPGFPERVA
ncbi:hypothetical protein LZK98_03875 [Sphingomonas cannabina]|uniref:hypothetical protein n=1 Tax=Sphingomonas cannabina TaxID=2899123 RepID=UPI001F2F9ABB|nr:hypothetical protein [Sphingomonas cannabina]UIJ46098.1 hypothetical protein LZK98_03875 [Sphingomonas cannabina]